MFTVDDGDLTIEGTITCNDDKPLVSGASACPIAITVSGNLTMAPGSAIYAENRRRQGNGGHITLTVGGDLLLNGESLPVVTGPSVPSVPGAIISSSRVSDTSALAGTSVVWPAISPSMRTGRV